MEEASEPAAFDILPAHSNCDAVFPGFASASLRLRLAAIERFDCVVERVRLEERTLSHVVWWVAEGKGGVSE